MVFFKNERPGASNTAIGLIMTTTPMLITGVANPSISFKGDRHLRRFKGDRHQGRPQAASSVIIGVFILES